MSQVQSVVSPNTKRELFSPTFTGETLTVKDMMALAGLSKVTILKLIAGASLAPVGKVVSGGRGRPAALYDRDSFLTLLKNRDTVTEAPVESDAVAGDSLSVDQINQALSDLE